MIKDSLENAENDLSTRRLAEQKWKLPACWRA